MNIKLGVHQSNELLGFMDKLIALSSKIVEKNWFAFSLYNTWGIELLPVIKSQSQEKGAQAHLRPLRLKLNLVQAQNKLQQG